jgi:hypothetical protein
MVANAKKIALLSLGAAYRRFQNQLEEQPEILAAITDIGMNAFAMESAWLRALKNGSGMSRDMAAVFLREAMGQVETAAREAITASAEGDALRTSLAFLKRFLKFEPVDSIGLRRRIAGRLLDAGRYII